MIKIFSAPPEGGEPPRLTRREAVGGWIMLPVYLALAGVAAGLIGRVVQAAFGVPVGEDVTRLIAYYLCFGLCVVIFRGHLIRELGVFFKNIRRCLAVGAAAYAMILVLSYAAALVLLAVGFEGTNPNQEAIYSAYEAGPRAVIVCTCLLGPLVEEVVFRSTVYGTVARRSRLLGHLVNWLFFGAAHVAVYAIMSRSPGVLLFALAYIPHSVGLAWAYQRSGSVWTCIFLHMIINTVSMLTLGAM